MVVRLCALLCVGALLIACLAAPIHKHDSDQEATSCLLCHVAERATVVAIDTDAGRPYITSSRELVGAFEPTAEVDRPHLARASRAPPFPRSL